jgi:hypothetical protein
VIVKVSYCCLAAFMISCILLALLAHRIANGKPCWNADGIRAAFLALLGQSVLLILSLPAVYDTVSGQFAASMVILFVIVVLGFPILCATYYYVTVLGGWLGRGLHSPQTPLPGTEIPELDQAMALLRKHDADGAARLVGEFLERRPTDRQALRFATELELGRGDPGRAASFCRRALAADAKIRATRTGLVEEERVRLLSLLADALEADGRAAEAAGALEAGLAGLGTERFRKNLAERARRLRGGG